jgi:hypothetical protein
LAAALEHERLDAIQRRGNDVARLVFGHEHHKNRDDAIDIVLGLFRDLAVLAREQNAALLREV